MPKNRIPSWFYNHLTTPQLEVIKEISADAVEKERTKIAQLIRNFAEEENNKARSSVVGFHDLEKLADAIERQDTE